MSDDDNFDDYEDDEDEESDDNEDGDDDDFIYTKFRGRIDHVVGAISVRNVNIRRF